MRFALLVLPPFSSRLAEARRVVEVAAGARFETALALARERPALEVVVTDVDPRVLGAPAPLRAVVDDLTAPRIDVYEGAALLYAVRLPEELQASALALARRVGAPLAVRALKDEWAHLEGPQPRVLPDGWRWWEAREAN